MNCQGAHGSAAIFENVANERSIVFVPVVDEHLENGRQLSMQHASNHCYDFEYFWFSCKLIY